MQDTRAGAVGVLEDTSTPWCLTRDAVERAKRRLDVKTYDDVAKGLGFDRRTFYRLLNGEHDVRLSKAMELVEVLDWPLGRIFNRVSR